MLMKQRLYVLTVFLLVLFSCKEEAVVVNQESIVDAGTATGAYSSDYFVFIADDGTEPLVLPIDFNWRHYTEGYEIEFKSWYGTEEDWPIRYTKELVKSTVVPEEVFDHEDLEGYTFHSLTNEITVAVVSSPEFKIKIPTNSEWVQAPSREGGIGSTSVAKTTIEINGQTKTGWLLYERIRAGSDTGFGFGFGFEAFFWMPVLVDNQLYHFIEHKGEQEAYRWCFEGDDLIVSALDTFNLTVTNTVSDATSGRQAVPSEVQIKYAPDSLDLTLASKGEQVGYGEQFPKGLAYYRQSLLVSTPESLSKGYGMMELILEDD